MNVFVTNEPCMLLETVELLYAFVNDIPMSELTAPGEYTIPPVALQQIITAASSGLSRQDPELQFFFLREPLLDGSGFTCLARCLVYNSMDFSCRTLSESAESLRRKWRELRQNGEHFSSIGEFGMDYTDPSDRSFVPLSLDTERLGVTPFFRQKLLEAFAGFDEYMTMLQRRLEPVAARLEPSLTPWIQRAEPLAKRWIAYYQSPGSEESLQQRACCSSDSIQSVSICLRYIHATAGPGVLDEETGTASFHMGVTRETERKAPADFEEWEYHALRLLGSPARMKMLQAMAEKSMTSREMAQQLNLHLSAVGRDVKSLFDARLLQVESIHGRNRYKTNASALEAIIQHLQALQEKAQRTE
ncbi:MAG: winged helix-turn-helix domain-containing protein [Faecousia sp.]